MVDHQTLLTFESSRPRWPRACSELLDLILDGWGLPVCGGLTMALLVAIVGGPAYITILSALLGTLSWIPLSGGFQRFIAAVGQFVESRCSRSLSDRIQRTLRSLVGPGVTRLDNQRRAQHELIRRFVRRVAMTAARVRERAINLAVKIVRLNRPRRAVARSSAASAGGGGGSGDGNGDADSPGDKDSPLALSPPPSLVLPVSIPSGFSCSPHFPRHSLLEHSIAKASFNHPSITSHLHHSDPTPRLKTSCYAQSRTAPISYSASTNGPISHSRSRRVFFTTQRCDRDEPLSGVPVGRAC